MEPISVLMIVTTVLLLWSFSFAARAAIREDKEYREWRRNHRDLLKKLSNEVNND